MIARELTSLGWEMTMQDSMELFLGMSISDMQPLIETRLGRKLPPSWRPELAEKLVLALGEEAKLIAGAREMLERVTELGIPWRIASNSSDQEMAVKFARTGLAGWWTEKPTPRPASSPKAAGRNQHLTCFLPPRPRKISRQNPAWCWRIARSASPARWRRA